MLRDLRTNPIILAGLLFFYLVLAPGYWIAHYQPVGGLPLPRSAWMMGLALCGSGVMLLGSGWKQGYGREAGLRFSRMWFPKVLILMTSLGFTLILVELAMRLWMIQSDGYGFTLMHHYWMERYWQPLNSMGYRDTEPQNRDDVQQILVTGDSFVAGHGINDYRDTFSQQLGVLLGDGYTVNIAAHVGWGNDLELDAVDRYPIQPDILILSYCFNDILTVAPAPSVHIKPPAEPILTLTNKFFIADFLYWHLYYALFASPQVDYTEQVLALYDDPIHWQNEMIWLQSFIENAERNDARLIVITWSPLNALEAGQTANAKVVNFFRERGITVVDMGAILAGKPAQELVVNAFDAHPNEAVHHQAADALYAAIIRQPAP